MGFSLKRSAGWSMILLFLCIAGFQVQAPAEWQKTLQPSLAGGALTCLAPHPFDRSKFLVASGRQVFEAGKEVLWRPLWSQTGGRSPITKLISAAILPDFVFVLAGENVFMGNLKDHSWRTIYQDSGREPLSFAVHPQDPNRWFLGTRKGLWETADAGKKWSRSSLFSAARPVPFVFFHDERFFLATESALFLSLDGNISQQVFALPARENGSAETSDGSLVESPSYLFKIHDLLPARRGAPDLFLATSNGVFLSRDHGHQWEPLPQSGLQSAEILQLASSERTGLLYAATSRGIYAYDARAQRWTCLFEGLARTRTQSIAVLNEEKLLAITGEGFVQYLLGPLTPEAGPTLAIYQPSEEILSLLKELLTLEPSVREVQKRVIRYANVSNSKTQRWHAESRLAGFLPTFSFGKNLDRSPSISTYSGKYITGPEDVSKGWDADVAWDLGDMIYSSDQTSIDSREKLMVELRNDLLAEATRIYYERRRLQIDLLYTPPASEQEHLENLLRMDELTALLDGMTDGFLSKRLEKIYDEKPSLNKLWSFDPKGEQTAGNE
ncbi:MAG: hypothetical protein V1882_09865 [Candidatus Omnitrophota bacterium]